MVHQKGFLIDMDGVIYRENHRINGAEAPFGSSSNSKMVDSGGALVRFPLSNVTMGARNLSSLR